MANPVGFQGANKVYHAPEGMENCRDLETFIHPDGVISCWRLTEEELKKVAETGVVWVNVSSHVLPPMLITGDCLVQFNGQDSKPEAYIPKKVNGGEL